MTRVAFDVTVSHRAATGVLVYAQELYAALQGQAISLHRWQHALGPSSERRHRVTNGLRLAQWLIHGASKRCASEGMSVLHATTAIAPFCGRTPVVMTVHDATMVTMPIHQGLADRLFARVFSVATARRATAILAPTNVAAEAIAEHYRVPSERIVVVPLGVAEAFHSVTSGAIEAARREYRLERPYVLYVGADTPRKNLSTLVRAMAIVSKTHADIDLVLAGPRSAGDAMLDAAGMAAGMSRPPRRLGVVPADVLPAIYAGAHCVAYVSVDEGFGLPIVEAMAAGTPVVTSNCSSMPEVAGDAALLVDPRSADAVADGLHRVFDDTALAATLRDRGRVRSRTFTWDRTARLTADVYRAVSGQRTLRALSPGPSTVPDHSPSAFEP